MRKIIRSLLIGFSALVVSMPSQAAMVGTVQMQANSPTIELVDVAGQRRWIEQQLVLGGVPRIDARSRVAAMTDAQVASLHQRIEQEPAGGNALVLIVVVVLFTELMGYTDFIPFIRPLDE
ncbi:MAG: PA2779 family protein [Gammaproteobacteria bacterium]|nr:PA2779 family protein [Gammaproteobacteria bacterium]